MIVVVSGLPRSGTSMMMRMLESANYPLLTDDIREADADNLLGYYEYEPVKNLDKDSSWIGEAEGKAVKIVSPLLMSLPQDHEYKVIFMERDIDEILASQSKMMERRGEENSIDDGKMREIYWKHLGEVKNWLSEQDNIETLFIDYNGVIDEPEPWVEKVQDLLGLEDMGHVMVEVVKPELYRQRK